MQMSVSQWRPVTQSETNTNHDKSPANVRGVLPLCCGMLGMVVVANRVRVGRALDSGQTPQPVTPPAWRPYWHLIALSNCNSILLPRVPRLPLVRLVVATAVATARLFLLIFVYISVVQLSVDFDCALCSLTLALCASCGRFIFPHS